MCFVFFFFEFEILYKVGIGVIYVGYLLVDVILMELLCVVLWEVLKLLIEDIVIVLLFGSCKSEINYIVLVLIGVVKLMVWFGWCFVMLVVLGLCGLVEFML